MPELEKILEEINEEIKSSIAFSSVFTDGLCRARNIIRKHMNDGWIPVEESLPDESLNSVIGWDEYREKCCFVQYYGGKWILGNREPVNIIAWRPLPEPYRSEQPEACKYTGGSCCWPIDQCSDCPNNPERSENDQ